jgi:hypothetical protein
VTDGQVGRVMVPATFVVGRSTTYFDVQARPFAACTECEFCIEVNR